MLPPAATLAEPDLVVTRSALPTLTLEVAGGVVELPAVAVTELV